MDKGWAQTPSPCVSSFHPFTFQLLNAQDDFALVPQLLKFVAAALPFREGMHNDRPKIDQQPASFGVALDAGRLEPMRFPRRLGDPVHERSQLALARTRADHKEIGEDRLAAQIQQDDIIGLLVFQRIDQGAR